MSITKIRLDGHTIADLNKEDQSINLINDLVRTEQQTITRALDEHGMHCQMTTFAMSILYFQSICLQPNLF